MLGAEDPGLVASTIAYRDVREAFAARGMVKAYLKFEAGLAKAQGKAGVIPSEHADTIVAACSMSSIDLAELEDGAARVGYPIVPLVAQLAQASGEKAGAYVHFGATTQDVMDTALVLVLVQQLSSVIAPLKDCCIALAEIADRHRVTLTAGRTKGQQAAPTSFGFKVAVWLDQLSRQFARLCDARENVRVVQFGGAVGTLSAHGPGALKVRSILADELGLRDPDITWHVTRDRLCDAVQAMTSVTNAIAKPASDIAALSATELGEIREPFMQGRGSSSTMPQKRNPVVCETLMEASRLTTGHAVEMMMAQVHDHERGLGFAHIERQAIARSVALLAGSVELFLDVTQGLEINADAMKRNMKANGGGLMAEAAFAALIPHVGRLEAHEIVSNLYRDAQRTGRDFKVVFEEKAHALGVKIDFGFKPIDDLAAANTMIDKVLSNSSKTLRSA